MRADKGDAGRSDLRFSEILANLAGDESRERISVGDILASMDDRAIAALIFVFSVPNCFPTPPGTSSVLGIPLIFLTAQLMLGMKPWLPRLIADRSMTRVDFAAMMARTQPWIIKAERMLKPRLQAFATPLAERLLGGLCLILALVLALPIPLGNMLPALALCIIAFGILEKDGVWTIAGTATGVVSLGVVAGVVYAMVKSAIYLLLTFFQ
ncbi:exopolysaccharide biosynthesis protein [Rhizobiales bacterium RZME27]|uniref:Exopolysaccharide biosynthesis protein n=1 Tax=Endobacterium cereale TaxID=2663029 RepID=A0A6A8ADS8_9HYPH|nr:exopolysaccharide biosynthesis protein [Endobacterium cereale]MQY47977.1 exopolysaccharide biosynthesis protein [Endobacterium cereale]